MTGFSHATTGVVIALAVHNPALALPLAFASHFVLDAVPHYGDEKLDGTNKAFRRFILIDAIAGFGISILMFVLMPEHRVLIALCAAMATIPDLMWLPNHIRQTKNLPSKPHNRLMRWHHRIQFEHPVWGILAEGIWLAAMISFIILIFTGS